jgi:hypothetical protein
VESATAAALKKGGWLRLAFAAAAACLALLGWSHQAHAATLHRAALVIEHDNGSLIARCVTFLQAQISGLDLIQMAGIEHQDQQFGSLGSAICQLDNEPAQIPAGCFGSGPYWQYFHRTSSGWVQSSLGVSSWMLHDGDMDGWHYASGPDQVPVSRSFAAVCGVAQPTPRATASVARSVTSQPSAINTAKSTLTPTKTPIATASATSSLEAMAPSDSPKVRLALTNRGSPKPPGSPPLPITWPLLGFSAVLLVGLMGLNLRRH